jgi:hypothetical protein
MSGVILFGASTAFLMSDPIFLGPIYFKPETW